MIRRDFIAGAAVLVAWPLPAPAQGRRPFKLAVVLPAGPVTVTTDTPQACPYGRTFWAELKRRGWSEGDKSNRGAPSGVVDAPRPFRSLAREVVALHPDAIIAVASGLVQQFKAATNTVSIVAQTADPVALD